MSRRIYEHDFSHIPPLWLRDSQYQLSQPQPCPDHPEVSKLPLCWGQAGNYCSHAFIDTNMADILGRYGPWFVGDRFHNRPPYKPVSLSTGPLNIGLHRLVIAMSLVEPSTWFELLSDLPKLDSFMEQIPRVRSIHHPADCRLAALSITVTKRAMDLRKQRGQKVLEGPVSPTTDLTHQPESVEEPLFTHSLELLASQNNPEPGRTKREMDELLKLFEGSEAKSNQPPTEPATDQPVPPREYPSGD